MDYNQRSRGQKSGAGHPACAPRRSVSSRMGLEKRGAPAQQPPRGNAPRPNQQRGPNQPPRSGQPPRQNRPGQMAGAVVRYAIGLTYARFHLTPCGVSSSTMPAALSSSRMRSAA